jgi:hypothetical protein
MEKDVRNAEPATRYAYRLLTLLKCGAVLSNNRKGHVFRSIVNRNTTDRMSHSTHHAGSDPIKQFLL